MERISSIFLMLLNIFKKVYQLLAHDDDIICSVRGRIGKRNNYQGKKYKKRKKSNPIVDIIQGIIILFVVGFVAEAEFREEVIKIVNAKFTGVPVEKQETIEELNQEDTAELYNAPEDAMELHVSGLPNSYTGLENVAVATCDMTGTRKANVVVDVGYGAGNYLARTNKFGQVVEMYAQELSLQTEQTEQTVEGRYCADEANVPGTEDYNLDQGHIIADVLGGVGNAYNITPQNSSVNQEGGEWYNMEQDIRDALGNGQLVSNFHVLISYPNSETQTPNQYRAAYNLNGEARELITDN